MKWRLVAAFLGITLVVLLVHDVPLVSYLRTVETDRIVTALERDSFIIAGKSEESLEAPTAANIASLRTSILEYSTKSGARVLVTNSAGLVLSSSDTTDTAWQDYSSRPEIATALKGTVNNGRRFSQTLNQELLFVAVPVLNGNDILGTVRLTFPSTIVDKTVNARLKAISSVAGITLLLAGIVALLLANSVTRRLRDLREVTEEFRSGNHGVRADAHEGAQEIRSLASSFNMMADQLNRLLEQQRAFAGDASHQLRTPLTALQLRLERATDLIETDPAGAAERLEAAMLETDRLQRLVEGLLVLSRAESKTQVETNIFNLSDLVRERAQSWDALANERGVTVTATAVDGLLVHAAPGALEQVIDNYVDNALEIVPENSKISIAAVRGREFTTLHVLDEGPGMPDADLEKAFNRFWRSRSDAHGSGLGLAIVERLVVASGGNVRLVNRLPNGLDAQADFPNA